jgi:HK97 family phage prohead protease
MRNGNKLGGYAAVFDVTADLGPKGREQIAPGAFDKALETSDVRALWNHNAEMVLGRQRPGTLRLGVDSTGLEYEVDLPDTSYARDLRELVERGDIDGASFGFVPGQTEWAENRTVRRHTSVLSLIDVSPVTYPAYGGATTEARSTSASYVYHLRSQLIRARARVLLKGM